MILDASTFETCSLLVMLNIVSLILSSSFLKKSRGKEDNCLVPPKRLKYFAEILNSLNFDDVEVLDPHSSVSKALINNISEAPFLALRQVLEGIEEEYTDYVVCYPDDGACKKYSDFITLPYCYGRKNRDWTNGKILGLDIITNGIDLKDKTILIIDDIISYGGSMYYTAKKLKELGCGDIFIYASHVENSILKGDLIKSGLFKKIYTTNSLFTEKHDLIQVL